MVDIITKLQARLGPGGVLTGTDVGNRATGFRNETGMVAKAIIRPRNTTEVAAVLRMCNEAGQAVVAQGGRTGLVRSHITTRDDLVLSLELMDKIEEIDTAGRTMTVQAGTTLQTIQDEANCSGLSYAVDLGARGSCTIGGNVSTNAGGHKVLRYGMTRENILGLEVVLADGTVVTSLNRMIKNNAGYDLKQLFIGTEGTLGIVTRVVLKLHELPASQDTALVALDRFPDVIKFFKFVDREMSGSLSTFEVMWQDFYEQVTASQTAQEPPLPLGYAYYVLVESSGGDQESDTRRFQAILNKATEQDMLTGVVVAKSQADSNAMWAIRDGVEYASAVGPVFSFDVSLQIQYMNVYVKAVKQALDTTWPGHHCFTFGHLGDGNLHYVISVGDDSDQARRKVEECVYAPLQDIGGSISAEHGIGLEKKPYLSLSRTAAEIALMRRLKQSLDPAGILNPDKIFDFNEDSG